MGRFSIQRWDYAAKQWRHTWTSFETTKASALRQGRTLGITGRIRVMPISTCDQPIVNHAPITH